jgi:CubicO group peptidase (beta-lactamase class C family)
MSYTKILTSLLFVFILLLNQRLFAQTASDSVELFLKNKMQELHAPGMQLAVIRHGEIIKLGAYGLANVENNIPTTTESVYSVNSITKAFVGVAVMQLAEQGKLNINDPISKYIDSLPVAWQPVTIKQVLTNSSGLPNIIDEYEHILAGGFEEAAWAKVKTLPMEFNPGDKFAYNQTGYVIIGKIITKLSGMHFTRFIQEKQFDVAGMKLSRFGDGDDVILNYAGAYSFLSNVNGQWISGGQLKNAFVEFPLFFRTAAGILSTAKEMAQWILALQDGRLLKNKESLATLWTPAILNDGKTGGFNDVLNGYALGWPVAVRNEHPAAGPVGGFRSSFFLYPKDDLTIIVLSNLQGTNPEHFIDEMAGFYIPDMKASNGFGLAPSVKKLRLALLKQGFSKAVRVASDLKKIDPEFMLTEQQLNSWGYSLISQGKKQEGLNILQLNVTLNPTSWNVYDSVAEAYELNGYRNLATKNYKRSLEINPDNKNAVEQLAIFVKSK